MLILGVERSGVCTIKLFVSLDTNPGPLIALKLYAWLGTIEACISSAGA